MLDKISEEIWTNLVCTIDNNIIDFFYTKVTHVLVNQAWAFSLPWRNNWDEQLKCLCIFIPIVRKPGISAFVFHIIKNTAPVAGENTPKRLEFGKYFA